MPIEYALLVLLHVVLFAYWLGGDLGVFYSAGFLAKPELAPATRVQIMKILHFVDQAPRVCLVLMFPVGTTIAVVGGYLAVAPTLRLPLLLAVWIVGTVWLWMVITLYTKAQSPLGKRIAKIDMGVRYTMIVGLFAVALWSFFGNGPAANSKWLAAKLFVYALLIINGLAIRITFRPFGAAWVSLMQNGSTPAAEATIADTVRRVRPVVLTLWALLLVAAYLGIAKPF